MQHLEWNLQKRHPIRNKIKRQDNTSKIFKWFLELPSILKQPKMTHILKLLSKTAFSEYRCLPVIHLVDTVILSGVQQI